MTDKTSQPIRGRGWGGGGWAEKPFFADLRSWLAGKSGIPYFLYDEQAQQIRVTDKTSEPIQGKGRWRGRIGGEAFLADLRSWLAG
jgi:hypothetical protein